MKTEWDLSELEKEKPEVVKEKVKKAVMEFSLKYKEDSGYLEDPVKMKVALDDYEELMRNYGYSGDIGYFAELKFALEEDNEKLKPLLNDISEFSVKMINEIQFFKIRISKISKEKQKIFLESRDLENYKHFLEKLFRKADYLLSEAEERIINLKDKTSYEDWVNMVSEFLTSQEKEVVIDGKRVVKNFSEILNLLDDKNKETRDSAVLASNEIFSEYAKIAEKEMNAILENKKIEDELRNIPRPDFSRHLSDDIETEVVDELIDSVSKRFDISKRYYKLKAKLLGFDKLKYSEKSMSYGKLKDDYKYPEAVELVSNVLGNIDSDFKKIFSEFSDVGRIDVYPKKGKRNGAFCSHYLITQPTYILLNFTGKLNDITTIAHEVGHGINNEIMKKKLNSLNFGTPTSIAEVASTFMEDFVLDEIMKNADKEMQLSILIEKLNSDISSIMRQTAFYMFEKELHKTFREKRYLTSKEIGELFKKHMENYLGDSVDCSGFENWWIYVPHFRDFFYVYSYASGLLISKALQENFKKDKNFIEKIKKVLGAGTSDSPKNVFKKAGIELNKDFFNSGLDRVEELLNKAEELAKELGKWE